MVLHKVVVMLDETCSKFIMPCGFDWDELSFLLVSEIHHHFELFTPLQYFSHLTPTYIIK